MKKHVLFPLLCRALAFAEVVAPLLQAAEKPTAQEVQIENSIYQVVFDTARGDFSILHKPTGKIFAKSGRFESSGGKAAVKPATDKTFGKGQAIEVVYPGGNRDTIALYPGLPFVLFASTLHNGTAELQTLNKVQTVSSVVDTGRALAEVKTLGTGGLLAPAQNPGSYVFLAIVDPASRGGVVGGWLTHERGSGVVFSPVKDGAVSLQAQIDYGRLRIQPGADATTETFAMGWFEDARLGLEAYADAVAKAYAIKLPPQQAGFCTWYMEKYGWACDEVHLRELSALAAKELKPFGFDFIQIDDEWQEGIKSNGPKKNFTTHAPKGPYPSGMKAAAEDIEKLGLTPGIWFMPFAGNYKDPFFAEHLDWFVKNPKGEPYETSWGGTCLDMTNPDAKDYVRSIVRRISHEWGYKLFKMDGYWTGSATKQIYVNDGYREDGMGDATFKNPDKTNIEALRDGTKLIREAAGPDVFLLGCCVSQNMRSFGGTFGLLDAMRVGPDTSGNIGAPHGSRLWFLNGRVWWNDPDCVFVRSSVSLDRARLNAAWAAISGQLFYFSDWLPETPAARLDILKRCMPAHGLPARPVDVFESDVAKVWLLTDTRQAARRDIVALYNWDKENQEISIGTDRIGLPPAQEYVGFDFFANKFVPPFRDKITATLPGNSCRILAVRPVAAVPQLLSTSRHVTQGIVDVTGEQWDATKSVLSGVSKVVGNDPYELRIVVPAGAKSWCATGVSVSPEDQAAGVKAEFKQDGPKLRATLSSATSREVKWSVQFEPGQVGIAPPPAVRQLQASAKVHSVSLTWAPEGADAYRVERDDGKVFYIPENPFTDTTTQMNQAYRYSVVALGWNGTASQATTVDVATERLKQPPTPPAPTVHLSDLKAIETVNGHGTAQPNKSIGGGPLLIDGKKYEKGLGAHAVGLAVYAIPAGATRFVSVVGLDDKVKNDPRSSVVFQIYGDVKEMGEKPVLIAESPRLCDETVRSWAFDVELNTRFRELRLVVTDGGDGNAADHADWVNAGFLTGAASLQ